MMKIKNELKLQNNLPRIEGRRRTFGGKQIDLFYTTPSNRLQFLVQLGILVTHISEVTSQISASRSSTRLNKAMPSEKPDKDKANVHKLALKGMLRWKIWDIFPANTFKALQSLSQNLYDFSLDLLISYLQM